MGILKRTINKIKRMISHTSEIDVLIANGMTVGKNCSFFSTSTIDSSWPWLISFGDNVTVSTNVTILAHDASPNVVGLGTKLGRVTVGHNVFIGTGVVILCDTTIGDNVIIGAGSVVSGKIDSNSVYCGAPAKKLYTLEEYKEKTQNLRKQCPDLNKIHRWDEWKNSSEEDKKIMKDLLKNGCGFV